MNNVTGQQIGQMETGKGVFEGKKNAQEEEWLSKVEGTLYILMKK